FTCERPPLPPLLPYTTLFRSGLASLRVTTFAGSTLLHSESAKAHQRHGITFLQCTGDRLDRCIQCTASVSFGQIGCGGDGVNQLDRKSTRLNSSHVKISYAVF